MVGWDPWIVSQIIALNSIQNKGHYMFGVKLASKKYGCFQAVATREFLKHPAICKVHVAGKQLYRILVIEGYCIQMLPVGLQCH